MTGSAFPTKLPLQSNTEVVVFNSIIWNITMFENGVSSYQNLDFPPAAQIFLVLAEIQAGGSSEFKLLAVLFPLI